MTGLIVEGGASRTYFAVGVMDAMMENQIPIDYITGASAGISNAMNYVSGQIGRGLVIGTTELPKKEYSGFKHLLNPKNRSLYNIDYVFNKVPNELVPYDYEAFSHFAGVAEAAVTNVETGKAEYIKVENPEKNWNLLVASCSLPLLFPMAHINGKKYLDGGIADSIPFQRALDVGCDKIIVILSRERSYEKKSGGSEKYSTLLFKKYPEFCKTLSTRSEMYNGQRKRLFELEKEGKALVIMPQSTEGWTRTENNADKIREIYNLGYAEGKKRMSEIMEYIK
ncbi:MAG: patatin family protein [Clostridia bacterium]|nr:patatin family protein [Clostridia bacterium]